MILQRYVQKKYILKKFNNNINAFQCVETTRDDYISTKMIAIHGYQMMIGKYNHLLLFDNTIS